MQSWKYLLLRITFFLGPTGMFFTPIPSIGSFRAFFVTTALINVFSLVGFRRKASSHLIVLFAILICLLSSSFYSLAFIDTPLYLHENPVIRAFIIGNLLFGFFNISQWVLSSGDMNLADRLLLDSFIGFSVVFFSGLVLYLLYIQGMLSLEGYSRFLTTYQEGYGYARFNPGTYPNEFGNICSFYAIYSIVLFNRRRNIMFLLLAVVFSAGIFLTSTRSAYLTAFFGYLYFIAMAPSKTLRLRLVFYLGILGAAVVGFLSFISFDLEAVLVSGYQGVLEGSGSLNIRFDDWLSATDEFLAHPFFGTGFESPHIYNIHSLPLQVLYGLGLLGFAVILLCAIVLTYMNYAARWAIYLVDRESFSDLRIIRGILFIHVVVFGLSNHNQAHFFTWMLFALMCIKFRRQIPNLIGNPEIYTKSSGLSLREAAP